MNMVWLSRHSVVAVLVLFLSSPSIVLGADTKKKVDPKKEAKKETPKSIVKSVAKTVTKNVVTKTAAEKAAMKKAMDAAVKKAVDAAVKKAVKKAVKEATEKAVKEAAAKAAAKAAKKVVVKKVVVKKTNKVKPLINTNWFKLGGKYVLWGLNQHGFLLGKKHPLNDADYAVQMLRIKARFGNKNYGVVTRFDAAQGWWGTDNSPNTETSTTLGKDANGNPILVNKRVYNPYKLFRNKDTNYTVHFDRAYLYMQVPMVSFPFRIQVGRQYFKVGNKLVLDQDYDGVVVDIKPSKMFAMKLMYAKVSMGFGSTKQPTGKLMTNSPDFPEYGDADLLGGRFFFKFKNFKAELFYLFYNDASAGKDWTYMPNGLGYTRSRFTPNLSQVHAMGLALNGKFDVLKGLFYKFEFDFLFGSDKVNNKDYVGNLLDINDGTLSGYNIYANVIQKFQAGIPMDFGVTFGMGSGDPDPRSGAGNINKLQTMGFFSLTNVWEDSVMPDYAGISPQGLGSPVSRGYRELENTIALQAKAGAKLLKSLRLEASFTYLMASQPIHAWDANGPTDQSATDIGMEIDANLIFKLYKNRVIYKALFGVFFPGKASGYLINGTDKFLSTVWELKQVVVVKF